MNLRGKLLLRYLDKQGNKLVYPCEDADFVCELVKRFAPKPPPIFLPMEGITLILNSEHVLQTQQFSRAGNLKLGGAPTIETLGAALKELAEQIFFPDIHTAAVLYDDVAPLESPFVKQVAQSEVGEAIPALLQVRQFLMDSMLEHEFGACVMLQKNLRPTGMDAVRIGPSSLYGSGVFATRRIPRGGLITLHPADYLTLNLGKKTSPWVKLRKDVENPTAMLVKLLYRYTVKVEGTSISIAACPNKIAHPSACAHLINDGGTLANANPTYDELCDYVDTSTAAQNCHLLPIAGTVVAAIAKKEIQKGEEVFGSYGAPYWINLLSQ